MNDTLIPLYKYISAENAEKVIASGKLQWSSPIKFNDPLDVVHRLQLENKADELNKSLSDEIALLIAAGLSPSRIKNRSLRSALQTARLLSVNNRKIAAQEIIKMGYEGAKSRQISALKILSEEWGAMVGQMRVLSLSERNDVMPMWAHYAEKGAGCVLEFQGDKKLDSVFLAAKKVNYSNNLPSLFSTAELVQCILGTGDKTWEFLFTEMQYLKTQDWENEREWRIVTFDFAAVDERLSQIGFFNQDLKGVYFGYNCNSKNVSGICNILKSKYPNAKTYKAFHDVSRRLISFLEI